MVQTTSAPQRRASDWPPVATDLPESVAAHGPTLPAVDVVREELFKAATGRKHDSGKLRWSLLPQGTVTEVLKVLEFGARKYAFENWKHVPEARQRYYDALLRHVDAWWNGEKKDLETGLHHLAHATCCALFLIWIDLYGNCTTKTESVSSQQPANTD